MFSQKRLPCSLSLANIGATKRGCEADKLSFKEITIQMKPEREKKSIITFL